MSLRLAREQVLTQTQEQRTIRARVQTQWQNNRLAALWFLARLERRSFTEGSIRSEKRPPRWRFPGWAWKSTVTGYLHQNHRSSYMALRPMAHRFGFELSWPGMLTCQNPASIRSLRLPRQWRHARFKSAWGHACRQTACWQKCWQAGTAGQLGFTPAASCPDQAISVFFHNAKRDRFQYSKRSRSSARIMTS